MEEGRKDKLQILKKTLLTNLPVNFQVSPSLPGGSGTPTRTGRRQNGRNRELPSPGMDSVHWELAGLVSVILEEGGDSWPQLVLDLRICNHRWTTSVLIY